MNTDYYDDYWYDICKILNDKVCQFLFFNLYDKSKQTLFEIDKITNNFPETRDNTLIRALTLNNYACYFRRINEIANALNALDDALDILHKSQIKEYTGLTNMNMGCLMS